MQRAARTKVDEVGGELDWTGTGAGAGEVHEARLLAESVQSYRASAKIITSDSASLMSDLSFSVKCQVVNVHLIL